MLVIIGVAPYEHEEYTFNNYTIDAKWNHPYPGTKTFWRTGQIPDSILELGIHQETHVLQEIEVVTAKKKLLNCADTIDFDVTEDNIQRGVPIARLLMNKPYPRIIDEKGDFFFCLRDDSFTIQMGTHTTAVRVLETDRTRFAINTQNELIGIRLTSLHDDEIDAIRSAIENVP